MAVIETIRALLNEAGAAYREVHHPPTLTSEDSARERGEDLKIGGKALLLKVNDAFRLFVVDVGKSDLRVFWMDPAGAPYNTVEKLRLDLSHQGALLHFAINGGIYAVGYRPQGLFIEQGKVLASIDTRRLGADAGNFYMEPNGIFFVDKGSRAQILTTQKFAEAFAKDIAKSGVRIAVQSGPLLLEGGVINSQFRPASTNKNRRTGVGVLEDGRVVFALASEPVNFYGFARQFLDLGCKMALYLDGGPIGSFLVEKENVRIQTDSPLVTFLGVVESKKQSANGGRRTR